MPVPPGFAPRRGSYYAAIQGNGTGDTSAIGIESEILIRPPVDAYPNLASAVDIFNTCFKAHQVAGRPVAVRRAGNTNIRAGIKGWGRRRRIAGVLPINSYLLLVGAAAVTGVYFNRVGAPAERHRRRQFIASGIEREIGKPTAPDTHCDIRAATHIADRCPQQSGRTGGPIAVAGIADPDHWRVDIHHGGFVNNAGLFFVGTIGIGGPDGD